MGVVEAYNSGMEAYRMGKPTHDIPHDLTAIEVENFLAGYNHAELEDIRDDDEDQSYQKMDDNYDFSELDFN